MKCKHFLFSFVLFLIIISGSVCAQNITYELPLRFAFTPSSSSSSLNKTSPLIPAGVFTGIKAYMKSGNVPWEISIPAKLTIQCPKNEVYPGNQVICRAWIESEDDPQNYELSSNYGLSMGIKLIATDYFFGHEYEIGDFGKDFNFRIKSHGKMPLGNNYLCGMDTVEFISFPLDEFIPGSSSAGKTIKTLLSANDIAGGYDILSFGLAAEIVIEGKKVELSIDSSKVEFTGFRNKQAYPDPSNDPNVKTFSIPIPLDPTSDGRFNTESQSMIFNPMVGYNFNAYYTAGLQFTLIPGVSFNIFPELVSKGANPLTYSCPSPSTLHNSSYYGKAADDFYISTNIPISIALPLATTPNLPDITITEVYINNTPGERIAYAGEETRIEFELKNTGNKSTTDDPYWWQHRDSPNFSFSVYMGNQPVNDIFGNPIRFRRVASGSNWLVSDPPEILDVNQSIKIGGINYTFNQEGYYELKIVTGYIEYKGVADGKPVYGIGDYNRANNTLVYGIYVRPPRGTVVGRIVTNPCTEDCGVNGITVCLRNISGGNYNECLLTSSDTAKGNGVYRFRNVPTGDYVLEYLPRKPSQSEREQGVPYYIPRRFNFHHNENTSDDFTNLGGMYVVQFQRVKGKVVKEDNNTPFQGVEVSLGEFGTVKTVTDANGEFTFNDLLPGREYKLYFRHPLYKTKVVTFYLSVYDSFTKDSNLTAGNMPYRDSDFSGDVYGFIKMRLDNTPPTLTVQPLDNKGFVGKELTFSFHSYDNDKTTYQYRYNILNEQNEKIFSSNWTSYPADNASVTVKQPLTNTDDGEYYIIVQVKDQGGNTKTGDPVLFKKDTTPPSFSVVLKDPVTGNTTATDKKTIDVYITLNNTEAGELALYLSNDGTNWEFIRYFTGNTTTVKNWKILEDDFFHGPKTVYAKVVDLAKNEGIVNQSINLDTTGAVILAGGSCCFGSRNNVPLLFDVLPPEGEVIFSEIGTGGLINIGDSAVTQYNAQKIVLSETKTINVIHFYMYIPGETVVGQPSPLNIKLIRNLSNDDPQSSNPNNTIRSWRFEYGDVSYLVNKYNGYLKLNIEPALTMTPGTYYLLVYTDSVNEGSYYVKPTGYYYSQSQQDFQNHMRYSYNPNTGTWVEEREANNGPIFTLSYKALYSPPGQIKIAPDGDCNNNWQEVNHEKNLVRYINLPHDGLNTVCVRYTNPISPERNGDYYASILIDTTAPTGTVTYTVDRNTNTLYFNINASDELTDVTQIKYTLPTGYTERINYSSVITVGKNTPLSNLFSQLSRVQGISFSFIDKVGNESQPYYVAINEADDIFPPEVQLSVNNGNPYTNNTNVRIDVTARDNFNLSKITIKELRTGKTWTIPESGSLTGQTYTGNIQITVPSITVDGNQVTLDGAYDFVAFAEDARGNVSRYTDIKRLILDREPPTISSVLITDSEGKSYTTQQNIMLNVQVVKDITPLSMRYRFKPDGAWSPYITIYPGITNIPITGPSPLPTFYILDVEVKDGAGNSTVKEASIRTNRRPNRPDNIMLSTTYSTTPRMSIDYSDPDNDPFLGASFVIKNTLTGAIVFSTGLIYSPSFEVPPGFLSYNTPYTVTGYVVDSYNLSSFYRETSFTLKKPTLTVNKTGDGTVSTQDNTIACGTLCQNEFTYNSTITLTAQANTGSKFSEWTGDCSQCGTSSICPVLMGQDKTCSAVFSYIPSFTLSTLKNGSYTNNNTINISGVVSDRTPVKSLTVKGEVVQLNTDRSFSHAVRLISGANTVDIEVEDNSGNKTAETRTIYYDPDVPVVNITSPSDSIITNKPDIIITGTTGSTNTVTISINNNPPQPVSLSGDTFSHPLTLSPGINTIYINATDASSGKTSSTKRTVIYDNLKPSIAITNPPYDITTTKNNMILRGEVSNAPGITVNIDFEGTTYTPNVVSGIFEIPISFSEEKTYKIHAVAKDQSGNESRVIRNIIYLTEMVSMELKKGWNFISFPRLPQNPSIASVMEGKNVRIIWGYDNTTKQWFSWKPNSLSGAPAFESGKGYWIYMNSAEVLDMSNWTNGPSTIALSPGWNLTGWNGTDGQPVETALSSLGTKWIIIWGWENGQWKAKVNPSITYTPPQPLNTLEKGKAYWIKMNIDDANGIIQWQQ